MIKDKKGFFITFEGADGCGKTTQINLCKKYLEEKKYETFLTLEPGGSDIGKSLRQILLHHEGYINNTCELYLYLADRAQHTDCVIKKNVDEGKIVLCDRYADSTIAYQGYARGGDVEQIEYLNKIATNGIVPDITFLFDVDSLTAQKRLGEQKDRLENEGLEFHKKIRLGYLELAKKYPQRIKVIDANQPISDVFEQVKKELDRIL